MDTNGYGQYIILDPEKLQKYDNHIIVGVEDLDLYDEYVILYNEILYNIMNYLVFR